MLLLRYVALTTLNLTLTTPNPTLAYPQDDVALLIQYLCRSFVMALFWTVSVCVHVLEMLNQCLCSSSAFLSC